jgi:hypothetical protein
VFDQRPPGADLDLGHVDGGHLIEEQKLSQLGGVDAVVLALAAEDQPHLARVGDFDALGHLLELLR